MPGRVFERIKRRMPCNVHFNGQFYSGLVLDVSPGGLFIQTSAKAGLGDRLDLELSIPGVSEQLRMQVEVMRKVVVPAQLRALAHGGIGVRILNAPEDYYSLMEDLGSGSDKGGFKGKSSKKKKAAGSKGAAPAKRQPAQVPEAEPEPVPEPEPEPAHKFRIRIKQKQGSRSRIVKLSADTEEEARKRALAEVDEGWEILQVEYL